MPELPEVEILKLSLNKNIKHAKIKKIKINNRNLRYKVPNNLNKVLAGCNIKNISRIAKYLIFHFNNEKKLLIHLGMSGTIHLIFKKNTKNTNASFYHLSSLPKKHNHIEISLNNNYKMIYNDPRRFGYFKLLNKNFINLKPFNDLGPEPFDPLFNFLYIKNFIKNKKVNIKSALLNQKFVSGIGNIYANEILFYCSINPLKKISKLSMKNIKDIINNSKKVLKKAIFFGGSSIKDFKKIDGQSGNFQQKFKVYGKQDSKCPKVGCKGILKKIIISNRASFYCLECQK
ncbi:MAG: bifunctional DNA-formamidopyrimidine glycosylase/DNA-(apurinic or apyrimidinic site) lyase [Candidatus Pelagibacterales bacterium]|nr:MAG: bifunctional DNA-formamidopyrimidine glycosylase/DNA-(apurinic or apyrimidinic site) lyase [Pelagibacterales bacterium]